MTLEAGKEMDRRCVMGWLSEVYRHPTVAFNTYSDEQQIEFAHDALVLLKEQEAVEPSWQNGKMYCGHCGSKFPPRVMMRFCHRCGVPIKLKVNDIVEQEGR